MMPCDSPIYVEKHKYLTGDIPVPCGKCPPCKKRRVDSWVFRLLQEEKISHHSHFVTFTYNTSEVPISTNGFMTLCKPDFQKFMKRLRKQTGIKPIYDENDELIQHGIRYYAVGEYGTKNWRPHYHAIIFNVPDPQSYVDAWGLGEIHVGICSGNSIAYTAKYIDKQGRIPCHKRDDRVKEFSLMSQGLGANYLTDEVRKYHKDRLDELFLTTPGGHRIAMPKYYRSKLFTDEEKQEQIKIIKKAVENNEDSLRDSIERKGLDYDREIHYIKLARRRKLAQNSTKNRKL